MKALDNFKNKQKMYEVMFFDITQMLQVTQWHIVGLTVSVKLYGNLC